MSLREMPELKLQRPHNYQWDEPSDVLARWADMPLAAEADEPNTITIFDVIGQDYFGGGFTAKRTAAALRSIGSNPVTVKINSPGGDMFEGIAVYNLLREHPAKVTVEIMALAASAASIIAMAGDQIRMALGSFQMVHQAWGLVVGNADDFAEASDLFKQFNAAIADIYEARTGAKRAEIERLMKAETFMAPSEAVKHGFADEIASDLRLDTADDEPANHSDRGLMARRKTEALLAKAGLSRTSRSELFEELVPHLTAARDAGRPTPRAMQAETVAGLNRLIEAIKG